MTEQEYQKRFLDQLLIKFFKQFYALGTSANHFINWFLTIVGLSISILLYNFESFNSYFTVPVLGVMFLGLTFSALLGLASKYFFFLSYSAFVSNENFSSSDIEDLIAKYKIDPDTLKKITLIELPNEIQERLYPSVLRKLTNLIINTLLKKFDQLLPYELSAKCCVIQLLLIGFSVFTYMITISYLTFLLMTF